MEKIKLDVSNYPSGHQFTVVKCEHCGVYFEPCGKPHKCKSRDVTNFNRLNKLKSIGDKKQYVVTKAYNDNYHVVRVHNGKIVDGRILAYYEIDTYIRIIESEGYVRAYYIPEYEAKLEQAKAEYESALKQYEDAKNSPLFILDEELKSHKLIFVEVR